VPTQKKGYGIPHSGGIVFREDARGVPLSRFRLHSAERFRYEYDFTADWKLDIRFERALPFDSKMEFINFNIQFPMPVASQFFAFALHFCDCIRSF